MKKAHLYDKNELKVTKKQTCYYDLQQAGEKRDHMKTLAVTLDVTETRRM